MGERVVSRSGADHAPYRSVLRRQVRGGLPALAGLVLLLVSQIPIYGTAALVASGFAVIGGTAAFIGGLALRWNDRGYAAGCLLTTAATIGAATSWVAVTDSSGIHWALLAAFGWATLLLVGVGHASPDDP